MADASDPTTGKTPAYSTEGKDTAIVVPEAEAPLAATTGAVISIDPDALLSGGLYISTRAFIGIGFGTVGAALALVLILRLTARRKDMIPLDGRNYRDYQNHHDHRD